LSSHGLDGVLAMNGQWIGQYTGTNLGNVMINLDDLGSHFRGVAYLTDSNTTLPGIGASFRTRNRNANFELRTDAIWAIHPATGDSAIWEDVAKLYPEGVRIPRSADVTGQWDERSLKLAWQTDVGTSGSCELPRSRAGEPSDLIARQMGWAEFKHYAASILGKRHLFRGQEQPWRLRTTFHRTGRADIVRFMHEDIQILHRRLSARTRHIFNLGIPDENGAFWNLVQHHGYPTPLLDWTYSPYVAAFFAYRRISRSEAAKADPSRRVRVFVLDQRWRTEIGQVLYFDRPFRHFSVAEFIAIENERMIPQQSVSVITNADDIETYLQEMELKHGHGEPYLTAIDLPVSERVEVLCELGYMGVTAGSLFPGLDGACEELKEKNFL
jgi:hypothetical protein